MAREKIYTRAGDDGTTGLFYGGRVGKDSALPRAYGAVDEAQAILGLARAESGKGTELDELLVHIMRDLWVLMAELATLPENRHKLVDGKSRVTAEMVTRLENMIDSLDEKFTPPTEFVVPGENKIAALLDVGRTVARRAERHSLAAAPAPSQACPYLNRLSDLLWTIARWQKANRCQQKVSTDVEINYLKRRTK
jgi:cob(I)alamin adenosyltransferase